METDNNGESNNIMPSLPTNLDISSLPEPARVNLLDFYEFLSQKYDKKRKQDISSEPRRPGSAKGKFTVPREFFEPLPEEILNAFEK